MENDNDFQEALASFRAKSSKTLEILYGGDGALVGGWREVRSLKAAFAEKSEAEEYAAKWSADNFESETMVEKIKVTIPAWDGTVPSAS